jgi:hypothetical protein
MKQAVEMRSLGGLKPLSTITFLRTETKILSLCCMQKVVATT